jgi:hypothetical protein
MTLTSLARPSYMPKYKPDASCVLYLEGQQDPQSATIKDLSGYANHGTITGATWDRLPSGLWVNSFDGTDDKVNIGHNVIFDSLGESTFMSWGKLTNVGASVNDQWYRNGESIFRLGPIGSTWGGINDINISGVDYTAVTAFPWGIWTLITYIISESTNTLQIWENTTKVYEKTDWAGVVPAMVGDDLIYGGDTYLAKGDRGLGRIVTFTLSATQIAGIFNQERHLFGV